MKSSDSHSVSAYDKIEENQKNSEIELSDSQDFEGAQSRSTWNVKRITIMAFFVSMSIFICIFIYLGNHEENLTLSKKQVLGQKNTQHLVKDKGRQAIKEAKSQLNQSVQPVSTSQSQPKNKVSSEESLKNQLPLDYQVAIQRAKSHPLFKNWAPLLLLKEHIKRFPDLPYVSSVKSAFTLLEQKNFFEFEQAMKEILFLLGAQEERVREVHAGTVDTQLLSK